MKRGPKPKKAAPLKGRPHGSKTKDENRIKGDRLAEDRALYFMEFLGIGSTKAARIAASEVELVRSAFSQVSVPKPPAVPDTVGANVRHPVEDGDDDDIPPPPLPQWIEEPSASATDPLPDRIRKRVSKEK